MPRIKTGGGAAAARQDPAVAGPRPAYSQALQTGAIRNGQATKPVNTDRNALGSERATMAKPLPGAGIIAEFAKWARIFRASREKRLINSHYQHSMG